ncbi:DNA gyrase subunit B [Marinitoga sp. 1135]|uniref:DNA topoisomerase (ATP-hydrolyzing) n=1 Tax=Marinitoga piezophila (strain DSM 14283 / JCM 11233 / KA3) TaxID=443254 RepID=H2J3Y9_MARPK|nr:MULTISPECIES: DNA topoisomerase subunit B [Marinitoga]AEX84717.1 type IIA topoisomerase (DNA gyrase/topo II, topoisomerase IV), B subunit [Marinitoga piezophila KA3]APT75242.1 DNA gyrase subunit B [Marinitoga sp. 1137]NUU95019.1 DNA gyrase subunit B [Marinitoga sp. 1135]NUU96975.1 DNA gyrase subunit B [Marinitoga sp. 1138]
MSHYSQEDIKVLKGLEPVRKRPGMYIGSIGKAGLNHLVYEIVDNSVDEYMSGFCTKIMVKINEDDTIEVMDNGRGIPVGPHPTEKKDTLEVVFTTLHAGGKFNTETYKISGGLHGVGASVVNALSEFLEVWVHRNGKIYYQKYSRGKKVTEVEILGETNKTGTHIKFKPDAEIFENGDIEVEGQIIENRLRELAFLNPGLEIEFIDEKRNKKQKFLFKEGLSEFLDYLIKKNKKAPIHESPIFGKGSFKNPRGENFSDIIVEFSMMYTRNDYPHIFSFVNNIRTVEGGEHESAFKTTLTRVMNDYAKKAGFLKEKDPNFTGEDVREGLIAILSIKLPDPVFEGQTKAKLGSKEVRAAVNDIVAEYLVKYLDSHPKDTKLIFERIKEAARARISARKAREKVKRKSIFENSPLPGKLADCTSNNLDESELFIVEGNSAGGNAKTARDRNFQAILPLRGKIINVEKHDIERLMKNEQVANIISAIGTGIGENFDISKLRYGKIIIMTDADVDGAHIRTLLLALFYRFMPELLKAGRIYAAQPPLYKFKSGKFEKYLYSDAELEELKKEFEGKKYSLQRYKGLGEMNSDQLWETTMNPEKRKLIQINIDDIVETEEILEILMGSDPSARREFIEEHALKVKELDI